MLPIDAALSVEQLQAMPLGELRTRRALAQTGILYAQVDIERERARREVQEIDAEIKRRGYAVEDAA